MWLSTLSPSSAGAPLLPPCGGSLPYPASRISQPPWLSKTFWMAKPLLLGCPKPEQDQQCADSYPLFCLVWLSTLSIRLVGFSSRWDLATSLPLQSQLQAGSPAHSQCSDGKLVLLSIGSMQLAIHFPFHGTKTTVVGLGACLWWWYWHMCISIRYENIRSKLLLLAVQPIQVCFIFVTKTAP